ncbi:MAG: DivIVA domain-containing protein [Candidatus Marinimicrobia bacterium]|nr:DivIVA domain-containing protein [Candidatus Neomarinimicrobiota bacterium]
MGRLTPQEIRDHDFKQSPLGYSRDQVQQFLDEVAKELEALIRESNEIHVENKEALLLLQTYKNVEDNLKETLLLAQNAARETLRNAQNEAETVIRKANLEKEALLFSAKEDLSRVRNEIRKLQSHRDLILIKLKNGLRTNLEILETEFSGEEALEKSFANAEPFGDERIVDFSKPDLLVDDLPPENEEPEIIIDDAEDFSRE